MFKEDTDAIADVVVECDDDCPPLVDLEDGDDVSPTSSTDNFRYKYDIEFPHNSGKFIDYTRKCLSRFNRANLLSPILHLLHNQ